MKHNFDLGDTVEDVSAPKKAAKGIKSPSSAKGTPKKDDKKSPAKAKAKKVTTGTSTRNKRSRVPTNFYLVQSSVEASNDRQRKETIDLASDEDDDEDEDGSDGEERTRPAAKKQSSKSSKHDSDDDDDDGSDDDEDARPAPKNQKRSAKSSKRDSDDDAQDDDEDGIEVVDAPATKRQRVSARTSPFQVTKEPRSSKPAKKDIPAKKAVAVTKKASVPAVPLSTKSKVDTKSAKSVPAKKEAVPPSSKTAATSSLKKTSVSGASVDSVRPPVGRPSSSSGLSEATVVANTKQNKILAGEIKALTNAINSGTILISTLWEQYQEVMQKDMELREAALRFAQTQQLQPVDQSPNEDSHDDVAAPLHPTPEEVQNEETAAAAAVAAALAVEEEQKEDDSTGANPLLL
ncbi:hypothetical protein AaE_010120 [Aphanomyces astaci]|uniref:Uncharacterized protein n=1 Tax=Aphanomyces astaci TaxID=112090 RepID=A0A6A5A629_APHAT|nr:hypothetical protein AaE_010120 [Aphanomyces astaci]